jgi:DMSO/TMAO reductase YedYZ molybdopterin-dependent catalytic subunit
MSLTLDDLRSRPSVELVATMECAGNGRALLEPRPLSQPWLSEAVGTARWTGVALAELLEQAGLEEDAVEVVFTGLDRGVEADAEQDSARSLTVEEARTSGAVLAYAMNGTALPPQHGFPLRLVVPGWYGMTNVKWLQTITAVVEPFAGYQQVGGYRIRREEGESGRAVTRMQPRALMEPPGIPEFFTRSRVVRSEPTVLQGRAWSGHAPIVAVEVSTDGGTTWREAELVDDLGSPWAWRGWRAAWEPEPGEHVLCCRARDEAGNVQPLAPDWNLGGYENNAAQRIPVTVESSV